METRDTGGKTGALLLAALLAAAIGCAAGTATADEAPQGRRGKSSGPSPIASPGT